jgi:polyphenol oxidase
MSLPAHISIPDFDEWGLNAFTTTRGAGTFGTHGTEPASEVLGRWGALVDDIASAGGVRFATASQVHGNAIAVHDGVWTGWLRCSAVDGHLWTRPGTAAAVTIADCVPVIIAHPSGAAALLHSGWRGTVAGITETAIEIFRRSGFGPGALRMHLGPSICSACYEVSPDVYAAVTGSTIRGPGQLDLRLAIADRARMRGVRDIAVSEWCTRCSNDRLFSHRAGDAGRQIAVLVAPREPS